MNDLEQLRVGVDAVKHAGGVVEATVCISGDMLKPKTKYDLKYYLNVVDKIVAMGTHIVGIKVLRKEFYKSLTDLSGHGWRAQTASCNYAYRLD